jgi:hypothetical protein
MSVRHPDARERRTLAVGATVAVVALLVAYVVMPTARRWRDREAAIDVARDRVSRLAGLASWHDNRPGASDGPPAESTPRALRGRTVALAAAQLQAMLQEQARLSRVSVERLEVAEGGDSVSAAPAQVTANLSATTDIYGVADLLTRLQASSVALSLDDVQLTANPVLRGNLLQLALTVRAPFVVEP